MRIFYHKSADAFVRRLVPGIAVLALAAWGIASGGAVLEDVPELTTTAEAADVAAEAGASADGFTDGEYKDGTYTGTAPGFGGDITVSVTIADGKITAIEIVSAAGETPSYLSRAKSIIDAMLEAQSPNVDVVSGATFSSNGIINAVKNALIKASGGTVSETTGSTGLGGASTGGGNGSTSSDSFTDAAAYADGTYTGSAPGYGGTVSVSVKISGGKIAAISIVSASGETASYLAKAKAVINKVIAAQSPNVDVVSGATYSSNGILNAIKKALNKAAAAASGKQTTEDEDTNTTPSDAKPDRKYTDGTYSGTGDGYGGDITVNVTILNSRINAIDVISAEDETPDFFARARTLIATILNKQTTKGVDVVSGATYSSNGILDAVNEALDKAAGTYVEPTPEPDPEPEPTPEPSENTTTEEFTYTGTTAVDPKDYGEYEDYGAEFDSYNITVKFTVTQTTTVETDASGNTTTTVERKLTGVEVTDPTQATAGNNWTYIKKAANGTSKITGVAAQAIAKQGFDGIDAVSGATCSSNAIVRAASQCDLNLGTTTK